MPSKAGHPERFDAVVVGGGIAGLSAAWQLRERRILVLEDRPRLGGRIISVQHNGYWANLGAHVFPGAESQIARVGTEVGAEAIPIQGAIHACAMGDRIVNPKRLEMYPLVLPLSVRERLQFGRAALKVAVGVRRFTVVDRPRPGETGADFRTRSVAFEDHRSFADYLGPLPPRVDAIFRCASRRAVAESEQLSAGAALTLFGEVLGQKRSRSSLARTIRGGTGTIPQGLGERLRSRTVCNAHVSCVAPHGDEVVVLYEQDGARRKVVARQVIVATPASVTWRIVKGMPQDLSHALRQIQYGAFVTMGIFTRERGPAAWDDLYAIATPGRRFDFLFNHANVLRRGSRAPGGSLAVFSGGPRASELLTEEDAAIEKLFLDDVYALFPELRGQVEETIVQRWPIGNAVAAPGRSAVQAVLERTPPGKGIHLAGDYFAQLGGMEHATRTGLSAARLVESALALDDREQRAR